MVSLVADKGFTLLFPAQNANVRLQIVSISAAPKTNPDIGSDTPLFSLDVLSDFAAKIILRLSSRTIENLGAKSKKRTGGKSKIPDTVYKYRVQMGFGD
jgi:hypothetical protein